MLRGMLRQSGEGREIASSRLLLGCRTAALGLSMQPQVATQMLGLLAVNACSHIASTGSTRDRSHQPASVPFFPPHVSLARSRHSMRAEAAYACHRMPGHLRERMNSCREGHSLWVDSQCVQCLRVLRNCHASPIRRNCKALLPHLATIQLQAPALIPKPTLRAAMMPSARRA